MSNAVTITIKQDLALFAVRYATNHWMENETEGTEPQAFAISDKAEFLTSFEDLYEDLTEKELLWLKETIYHEHKWCEETLSTENLDKKVRKQVEDLLKAYQHTTEVIKSLEN